MRNARAGWSIQIIVILLCSAAIGAAIWYAVSRPWSGITILRGNECEERDGDVVNTLGRVLRYDQKDFLGDVEGTNCPCVCLRKGAYSVEFFEE